jgi:hypothetical protein
MNAIAIKMTPVKGEWIVYEDRDPNGLRRTEPRWITSTPGRLRVRPNDRFELHLYPGQGATTIEALGSLGIADQVARKRRHHEPVRSLPPITIQASRAQCFVLPW